MITAAYIIGGILVLVWAFLLCSYCLISFRGPDYMRGLDFWQFIDFHFYGIYAAGFKGLDVAVKLYIIIYMLWQFY